MPDSSDRFITRAADVVVRYDLMSRQVIEGLAADGDADARLWLDEHPE